MEYRTPTKPNRVLNVVSPGKGKKHYWGEKGKDYGYFTSQNQTETPYQYQPRKYIVVPRSKTQATYYQQPTYNLYRENSQLELDNRRHSLSIPRQGIRKLEGNLQNRTKNKNLNIEKKNIDIVLPKISQKNNNNYGDGQNPQKNNYIDNNESKGEQKMMNQRMRVEENPMQRAVYAENNIFKSNSKLYAQYPRKNYEPEKYYENNSQRIYYAPQIQNGYSIHRKRVLRYTPTFSTSRDNPLCGIILRQQNR